MWADTETDKDFLNYSEVAELATDLIKNRKMLPLSLGIFGGWGAGKSSMLRLIEKDLVAGEQGFLIVKFDAWLYQDYDDARAALMEVIAGTLLEAANSNEKLVQKVQRFAKRIDYFRLAGLLADAGAAAMGVPTLGLVTKGSAALARMFDGGINSDDYEAVKAAGADLKNRTKGLVKPEENRSPPEEIATFRQEFGEILASLDRTLVVFIDNLDRCLPRNAIHTLEAVRLFLFLPRTAFVVAADEEMIRHAVSEHYGNLNERLVTDYLDKLIQVPIHVPRLGVHEVRAYMFMLFASAGSLDPNRLEALRSGLERSLRESWKDDPLSVEAALALLADSPPDDVVRGFGIADRMAPILANSSRVQGNPRIVKRMLNVVRMRAQVARKRNMPLDETIIAKLALFERCTDAQATAELHRAINEAANGKPELLSRLEELADDPTRFEAACPDAWKPKHLRFVGEWVTLEPRLGGTDLRPALYLSRETMPLRFARGGLSAQAAEAVAVLLRVPSRTSVAARQAVSALDSTDCVPVMEALVAELRKENDWRKRPGGFDGALVLADHAPEAGRILAAFIRSLGLSKLPPWLNAILKDAEWYKEGEKS